MPHKILIDQLEQYLAGEASPEFHDHIAVCAECRNEITAMQDISQVVSSAFQAEPDLPGLSTANFYENLSFAIVEQQKSRAWGLFSPGIPFFRRVAFASLLLLAGLGSYLVTRESSQGGTDAAAIMAQHDVSDTHPESADRNRLLVTLVSYTE